ncbi:MAG: pydB [Acidimicrobiales bacterium]|nr:pydB [Acidimicrobiales bacterium]
MARTLIAGGTVVSATGRSGADVLIDGETIAAILPRRPEGGSGDGNGVGAGDGSRADGDGATVDRVIDASGMYVIPGGVDVHTHLELPVGDLTSADTFESGTIAAAWGGVTTIVDFASQEQGGDVRDSLAAWHDKAAGHCAIDYGFHQIIGGVDDESLAAMRELVDHEGVTSFKLFMAYPGRLYSTDGQILRAMQVAGELGAMTMIHAENGIAIDVLVQQALARGDTAPAFHSRTRPSELEAEAVHRATVLADTAGNVPLYIVHLSSADALGHVAAARAEGRNVFAETCPQYLYLTLEETLAKPGFEGADYVCSPPIRSAHDRGGHGHAADLWAGLRSDDLAVVSTDHCPFCTADRQRGRGDFSKIPNGIGTIEHRMELMYQGVVAGELTLERWVDTCCTAPARMFGLAPRKGSIGVGADADVVVWDPAAPTTLGLGDGRKHHMAADHSVWEGFEVAGRARTVLSRGEVIVDADRYLGRPGHGRYLPRSLSPHLR